MDARPPDDADPVDAADPDRPGARQLALEPRLALAAQAAKAGAYEWDMVTGAIFWDEVVCRLVGVAPDEFDGRAEAFFAALDPADAARLAASTARVIETGGAYRNWYQVNHPDGRVRRIEERGEVLFGADGRPERFIGLLLDRTDEGPDPVNLARPTDPASAQESGSTALSGLLTARSDDSSFVLILARALSRATTVADVLRVMTDIARPSLGADNLLIDVIYEDDSSWIGAAAYGEHVRESLTGLRDQAAEAMRTAVTESRPLFVEDIEVRGPDGGVIETRSWAVLPLSSSDVWVGACLFAFTGSRVFDDEKRAMFTALSGILAQALARAKLYDTEHQRATQLQRAMLPRRLPDLAGFDSVVRYLPASAGMLAGGDWYDQLRLADGSVGLVIGDVQGHSAEASAVMGQLRIAIRAFAAEGHGPSEVLARTGRLLAGLDTDLFATCCYLQLNPDTGELLAARAGHPHPVMINCTRPRVSEFAIPGGPPLGVDPSATYPWTRTVLAPGDALLLYTDGLVETRQDDIEESVRAMLSRIQDCLRGTPPPGTDTGADRLDQLAECLVRPVLAVVPRQDDVALMLVRRLPEPR
ncbi:SpoIIE family protein phosphatase [Streptacidiphilus sp. P02-A3a]|uniref:SpoIIE family protein phosphatase n=1 Tax=Streptacidiphilus sp. P02-A3a TaxID=2704468 RepID=UPI0015F8C394|nr:SpoIIE family protein phosphatase [Streptacidiphilus sp. P02-A3a]QMU68048.1 SpoIIE family protein phosphatase [Streptacidiphilus sp. P02-A3a]